MDINISTHRFDEMGSCAREGKPMPKLEHIAVCSSLRCKRSKRGERKGTQDGVIKDVSKHTTSCPDCGHVLYWKTKNKPAKEISDEEKERRKLRRQAIEENQRRQGKTPKKKGRPRKPSTATP